MWKLFWNILAVVVGLYTGYRIFIWCGEHIPAFGYFPLGVIGGLAALGFGIYLIHGVELLISWIIGRLFKIQKEEDLPFN
ncbi:MAG: hypothetical protein A2431_00220 [Candidatus Zambryskibacteria bacterium RIFOXYC1_FULL_39_10]|uniref:Uncharacterized protein n=1 Tax=Candidatus Zambryskibacteria bacterium RIFOXYC1_FULL_39_10 TaxID=1802779 RepID=A0A1G2UZD9_9BACT|nr:MAG: hypothetical protein A2431_00220 [Candidatus Zambryskibacteria bacterium RIFOXYC1_FULL_39_10]OHB15973.1 MAG: hypothetical protein A2605_03760 [Candidatus Zambryskibacteria bacterium RIFOXYD1_FULL_39_35]